MKPIRGLWLYQLLSNFKVSISNFPCYELDNSYLAGRSVLFLDEKKRTKEKSLQNNAAALDPYTPSIGRRRLAVGDALFCRASAPELDKLIRAIDNDKNYRKYEGIRFQHCRAALFL